MAAIRIDSPLRLTLGYLIFGAIWMISTDGLVMWMSGEELHDWFIDSSKGMFFLAVTGTLLFFITHRMVQRYTDAVQALQESEKRWQFALEGSGDGLWDWNAQTNKVYYSKQWKAMLGFAEHEIGDSLSEWESRVHPDDLADVMAAVQRHHNGETDIYRCEHRLRAKDGTYRWVLDRGQVVSRDATGKPVRVIGSHSDITARKQAEAHTEDALQFSRTVMDHSPIGIITYGPDGHAVTANEAAARIIGTDLPTLLRQNFRELESWRKHGLFAAAETALAAGHEILHAGRYVSSFGHSVQIEVRFVPFRYEGQQHLLLLITDETTQQQTLENLNLMNTAVQAAPGGWVVTDAAGNIQWINPGFTQQSGYTPEDVAGQNMRLLRSNEQNDSFYARMWQTIRRGEVWSGELVNRRKDGTLYQVYMTIAPVRNAAREITQYVAMQQDISERKNLERQLARTQRLESIGLLASGIAHDLNNILAPITLSLELLRLKYNDAGGARIVELIEGAAQRGSGIVRQVLTFARGLDGTRVEVQPKHLLKDIRDMASETFPRNIRTELNLVPDLWALNGDVTQLHQVLLNLAVNARDAMPVGGTLRFGAHNVTIEEGSTRGAGLLSPGKYVALTVGDTGTGIPPEVMERIFEPFFTTKPQGKGTGLGLSTVYGIVRSHGGMVEVNTKLGHGTEFCVLLPALHATGSAAPQPSRESDTINGLARHILVVDDEETIRVVTGEALRRHGFVVETASDGIDGLAAFKEGKFDAVITDLMMPRMNGYQLVREIRQLDNRVPILASSGMTGDTEKNSERPDAGLVQQGVDTLLLKPYTEAELLHALAVKLPWPAALQKKD